MIVSGIKVVADSSISADEVTKLVTEEKSRWENRHKKLGEVKLVLEGDEILVHAVECSPIRRVRRITGYLSSIDNFNDAKVAECKDRTNHIQ